MENLFGAFAPHNQQTAIQLPKKRKQKERKPTKNATKMVDIEAEMISGDIGRINPMEELENLQMKENKNVVENNKKEEEKEEHNKSTSYDISQRSNNSDAENKESSGDSEDNSVKSSESESKSPPMKTFKQTISKNCIIEGVIPPKHTAYEHPPHLPQSPAKEYKFKLDNFQIESIKFLERRESVLVSAHTSAGKTAIAEYAIAMALRDKQRVIYTSPIKALSNQKYRDLEAEFTDVGLMTGDVTINPTASCLVMTTEILRNMLYKGSEVTREMAWVVFDEVHYMRDKERGVVWEETIILIPSTVKYVFLSATIPNALQFAYWIATIKNQPCNVVYTDYRPVPLRHYIYPFGARKLFLVVDEKGVFKEHHFTQAVSYLNQESDIDKLKDWRNKKDKPSEGLEIKKLIREISNLNFEPCIVFSFSKRECEAYAKSLQGVNLNSVEEQGNVDKIYRNAMETLSEEDRDLPMIKNIIETLKRGIGFHHGGLLPIVKEVIEILFQESLIKVLFTTETFSMGINMPAKTVIFSSIEKFDGNEFRWLGGGEYIQMSGRAGRRGKDDRGICILMANKKLDQQIAKTILKGNSDPLNSAFHLTYNMLLNLLRVEDVDPAYLIKRSFHQFQFKSNVPKLKENLIDLKMKKNAIKDNNEDVLKYRKTFLQLKEFEDESHKIMLEVQNIIPWLVPGRMVKVKDEKTDWGWGIVVHWRKYKIDVKHRKQDANWASEQNEDTYMIDVLLYINNNTTNTTEMQPGILDQNNGKMGVVPVKLPMIDQLSKIQVKLPQSLKDRTSSSRVEILLTEVLRRYNGNLPILDPIEDMQIESPRLIELQHRISKLRSENIVQDEDKLKICESYRLAKNDISEVKKTLKLSKKMVLSGNLVSMQRVLRRLEFCTKDMVQTKGKVACEISVCDEILTTELIFNGAFSKLEPPIIAALLSCLVYTDHNKSSEKQTKKQELLNAYEIIKSTAERVANVMIESKIQIQLDEYRESFKPDLMEVTYAWCKGAKFAEICAITDIYEGTIIRCLRRLEELLKQLINASTIIGNTQLQEKFTIAGDSIRRDIVFAASLYL